MSPTHANPIAKLLAQVRLGPRQESKEVALWPLVPALPVLPVPPAQRLEQALEDGWVAIDVGRDDRARVLVENRSAEPVLLLGGEPVGDAGQAVATRWLAPQQRTPVAVAPAERDREGPVACAHCVRGLVGSFHPVEGQVGFVASVDGRPAALDLLLPGGSAPELLAGRLGAWAGFLITRESLATPSDGLQAPEDLLGALARARVEPDSGGEGAWAHGPGVTGRLVRSGPVAHLAAWSHGPGETRTPLARG